jgi:hypothetical protein
MIESRRMRWAERVTNIKAERNAYRAWVRKPERKRPLRYADVGEWILLKWILKKQDEVIWIGLI